MAVAIYIPPRNSGLVQKQIDQLWTYQFLVFKEQFYGDGTTTQFQLTGDVLNCEFISGGWKPMGVVSHLGGDITDTNNQPLYDKSWYWLFTRHRINVESISGSTTVNLDYPPISGQPFYLWYWYNLQKGDRIDSYYREDYVAKMEEEGVNLATNVSTNSSVFTNNILTVTETDVQKALEKIDLTAISKTETAAISSYLQYQISNITITGGSFTSYTLLTTTAALTSNLQDQINNIHSGAAGVSSPIYSGTVACNPTSKLFHISHAEIDVNNTNPVVSLVIPNSASIIYVQGITNRTTGGFDVVLTDAPGLTGYKIDWMMPLTNAASGNFVSQAYVDDNFTLLTTTASLTSNLQNQIAAMSGSIGSPPIYSGSILCDPNSKIFHVTHEAVVVSQATPVVSLVTPSSSSIVYIQGITNRTTTGFDITLTDIPGITGYILDWIMPLTAAASGNFIIIPQSYLNNYTLLTNTSTLTANLQYQIINLSASNILYTPPITSYFYDTSIPTNLQIATNNLAKSHYFTRHTTNRMTSTGLSFGGDLVGTLGTSAFNISSGYGYIIDQTILDSVGSINPKIHTVSWSDITNISVTQFMSAGYSATYVLITSAGNHFITPIEPTSQQIRDYIYLGKVSHRFGSINSLRSYKRLPVEIYSNLTDLNDAIGPLNLTGNIYSANDADLKIQKSAGTSYRFSSNSINNNKSPHITTDPVLSPVSFRPTYRASSSGLKYGPSTTNIDPDYFDNGSGTLQSVPNNNWTIQRIYFFPVTNSTYVFYGQATYSSLDSARNAITSEEFIYNDPDNSFSSATFRGWLLVKKGETNLSSADTRFIAASKYGNIMGGGGGINTISNVDYIAFNTNISTPPFSEGNLYYDKYEKCISLQTDIPGVTLNIGEENYLKGYNNTGSTIYNGTVVYTDGVISDRSLIFPAIATTNLADRVIGVATHDIENSILGKITTSGLVHDVNTENFTDGQVAYLSSIISGGITPIKPIAPNHLITIGNVLRAHPTQGILYVNIRTGYELNELHDVYFPYTLQDGQLLTYSSSGSRWENQYNINNYTSLSLTHATSSTLFTITQQTSANAYQQAINKLFIIPSRVISSSLILDGSNWATYHNSRITSSTTPVIISTNIGLPDGFETEIIQNGTNIITISSGSMTNYIAHGYTKTNGIGAIVSLRVMNDGSSINAYTDGNLI
jgi:hypothetical protein